MKADRPTTSLMTVDETTMKIERHWITADLLGVASSESTQQQMENARKKALFELFREVLYHTRNRERATVVSLRFDPLEKTGTVGVVLADGPPYLDRNQPVLDSRPCEKHERPEPDCPECRFRDEPPYRITP